jgi:hypothetical protein
VLKFPELTLEYERSRRQGNCVSASNVFPFN